MLATKGRGRETALVIVDALQRARKRGAARIEGAWWDLLARLDVEPPASKTARAALAILAKAGIVVRVSGQRWRFDTVALERAGRELQAPTVAPAAGEPTDEKRTPGPSPDRPGSRRGAARGGEPLLSRTRGRVSELDRRSHRRVPLWRSDPHPLVSRFVAAVERAGALGVGQATVVTLTVAPGADLDAVGRAFVERYAGLLTGAWLVPETSQRGLRHYHGLVIAPRAEIIGAWQRCDGGIARAQRLDPLESGGHEHLLRAVAYAMKRRHVEPGDVIASGVLASPWADDRDQRPVDDDRDLDQRPVDDERDDWPGSDDERDHWPGSDDERDHWPGSDDERDHCPGSDDERDHWPGSDDERDHWPGGDYLGPEAAP